MFVTDQKIIEVAENLQPLFESGPLHSRSSIKEIADHAVEELRDLGLPTRRGLAIIIAKLALGNWHETILKVRRIA